jgi:hypothetical protein
MAVPSREGFPLHSANAKLPPCTSGATPRLRGATFASVHLSSRVPANAATNSRASATVNTTETAFALTDSPAFVCVGRGAWATSEASPAPAAPACTRVRLGKHIARSGRGSPSVGTDLHEGLMVLSVILDASNVASRSPPFPDSAQLSKPGASRPRQCLQDNLMALRMSRRTCQTGGSIPHSSLGTRSSGLRPGFGTASQSPRSGIGPKVSTGRRSGQPSWPGRTQQRWRLASTQASIRRFSLGFQTA